jgi:hypothetical protein
MFRVSCLIPIRANDGRKCPRCYFSEFEEHLTDAAPGWSRRDGLVIGSWRGDDRVHRDTSREYFIDIADEREARELALALYRFIAHRFEQLAVSINITPHFSTVLMPKGHVMTLSSKYDWHPLPPARRQLLLPVLIALLLFFVRCDVPNGPLADSSSALERAAGIESQQVDPVCIDLLLDGSEHSPGGDLRNLSAQLDVLLPTLTVRTGVLRLWVLRDSVEQTTIIATEQFAASKQANLHVSQRERDTLVRRARERFLAAAQVARTSIPARSPLFDVVSRIGMTTSSSRERVVILISDLKEVGYARWECGPITTSAVIPRLDDAHVLLPNSLRGITVVAAFFDITPATCHDSIARHLELLHAWGILLQRAGARAVFVTGPFNLKGDNT